MEASLLQFIFHIAHIFLLQVAKNFREDKFQRIGTNILHRTAIRIFHLEESLISDIKSGTIYMSRILRSIDIALAQSLYIVIGTKYRGYNHLIRIQALAFQRIKEICADTIQQSTSLRYQERNGMSQCGKG